MRQVNIHEAKTHLSRLVDAAAKGEPFVIAKAGEPLVEVVAIEAAAEPISRFGWARHLNWKIPDDFDTLDQEEIIRLFEGEDDEPAPPA